MHCLNEDCPDHGRTEAGNLHRHGWTDKHRTIRRWRCRTCKREFSERRGTALYRSKLAGEKSAAVLEALAKGKGVRKIAREAGVHQGTVIGLRRKQGRK